MNCTKLFGIPYLLVIGRERCFPFVPASESDSSAPVTYVATEHSRCGASVRNAFIVEAANEYKHYPLLTNLNAGINWAARC